MPDGQGGYLLTGGVTVNPAVTIAVRRIDPNLVLSPMFAPVNDTAGTVYQADFVLGEDAAWAFFEGRGNSGFWQRAVSFDPVTLQLITDNVLGSSTPEPQYSQLRTALGDGGIYISGPASAFGGPTLAGGGNASQLVSGIWHGWSAGQPTLAFLSETAEAQTVRRRPRGDRNENADPRPYDSYEEAALAALDFIYPWSAWTQWEWGGLICEKGNKYLWSRIVTGILDPTGTFRVDKNGNPTTNGVQDKVDVSGQTSCGAFGAQVAHYHTHPPIENPNPSSIDFLNADAQTSVTFYLRAPGPQSTPTHTLWYYKSSTKPSSQNIFERVNGGWQPYVP
jgi:hypothetical protein